MIAWALGWRLQLEINIQHKQWCRKTVDRGLGLSFDQLQRLALAVNRKLAICLPAWVINPRFAADGGVKIACDLGPRPSR